MIPVAIDPTKLRLGLVARGAPGQRRLDRLKTGGAAYLAVFCDEPDSEFAHRVPDIIPRLPTDAELVSLHLLWLAGLPEADAIPLAWRARTRRVPVNVEDKPEYCDFHNVAELRRGDLLLTVSTGGHSPGLAAAIRARLARQFGPDWEPRQRAAARRRLDWRAEGMPSADVGARLAALAESWLA